jgi:membrane associated rhomboid family serine protease
LTLLDEGEALLTWKNNKIAAVAGIAFILGLFGWIAALIGALIMFARFLLDAYFLEVIIYYALLVILYAIYYSGYCNRNRTMKEWRENYHRLRDAVATELIKT